MKNIITIVAIVFCTMVFTSCTDESVELSERIENERQIELRLVDPRNNGTIGQEEGDEETGDE